ncbi:MAG: TIGR03084 family metal-binding protein [Halioglobus sp.]
MNAVKLPQAADFLAESRALYELLLPLSDNELAQSTQFKGWSFDDVIQHLHVWNWAANESLVDEASFSQFIKQVFSSSGQSSLKVFERQWLNNLSGRDLLDTWHAFFTEMAPRFAECDPKLRLKWAGPDMSARSSITARLMETWAHGQEIYDELGVVRVDADRIKNIVILGVNTYGWTYACREQTPPGPMPWLTLTAPSGELWKFGEQSQQEHISGPATEFCQVVTQVRNIKDTNLVVQGSVATDWMSKAQCFAGSAESPPAPGTRFTRGNK